MCPQASQDGCWFVTFNPNHLPSLGEPLRISTATRTGRPVVTRINFPIGGSHWKWSPRNTPLRDREWLSWTNSPGRPNSRNWSSRDALRKKPWSSCKTSGVITKAPLRSRDSIVIFIQPHYLEVRKLVLPGRPGHFDTPRYTGP